MHEFRGRTCLWNSIRYLMPKMCVHKGAAVDAQHHIIKWKLERFQIGLGNRKAPGWQLP